jgi:hypothetical protein
MKWLLALFALTHALTPKLCIHCIHFITDGACGPKFGKCRILPITHVDENYLVTGVTTVKTDYHYCSTARNHEHLCGEKGKRFKKIYGMD